MWRCSGCRCTDLLHLHEKFGEIICFETGCNLISTNSIQWPLQLSLIAMLWICSVLAESGPLLANGLAVVILSCQPNLASSHCTTEFVAPLTTPHFLLHLTTIIVKPGIRLSRGPHCRSCRRMLVQKLMQDLVISVNKNSWIGRRAIFISTEILVFTVSTESVYIIIKLLPYSRFSSLVQM